MTELIEVKVRAFISIASIMTSWFVAQASIIEQGFDQLFSLGLLIVAVIVIWKAFSKKDESETELLKEQVELFRQVSNDQSKTIHEQAETIRHLRKSHEATQDTN